MEFKSDSMFNILIANLRNYIKRSLESQLKDYDITPVQSLIILRLCEKNNLTQREIAEDTFLKQSSLTLIIDKMEKKGFIERKAKKEDRRAYLISITKKGRELKDPINAALKELDEKSFYEVTLEEKNLLINILRKIDLNLK